MTHRPDLRTGTCADWGWTLDLDGCDADGEVSITMVMRNVVPESAHDMLPKGAQTGAHDVLARWGSE